jgi:hypothetical protein
LGGKARCVVFHVVDSNVVDIDHVDIDIIDIDRIDIDALHRAQALVRPCARR